jgi:P-type Cu+ transporter
MGAKKCYHCGSTTGNFVKHDNKDFCCHGCVTVYEILRENKLYTYYNLEITPGVKADQEAHGSDYSYLEQDEIKNSVLDFYDGKIAKIRLYIPSIHCSSCIWLLENLHRINKGILYSSVNFTKKEVSISFDESIIHLPQLMQLLESIHYKPVIQQKKEQSKKKSSSQLVIKLGIAGFAFGNVMLLSFPEYLSDSISHTDKYIQYFGWISLFLSLPVMVYSASDYFLSAWKNLGKKVISIDLPIAIGISTIFFRSVWELFGQYGSGYFDSLTGLVFFLLVGKWYQDKTYQALNFENEYTSYFPLGILRVTDRDSEMIPIRKIRIGDRIRVRNSEIIPADSILESENGTIDYSFITGESIPVEKHKGDKIFAGGRQMGSSITLVVEKNVETSYLAQLWKEHTNPEIQSTFFSATLDKVSKYFTITVLIISILSGLYWVLTDISLALIAFTSVLIVACPCALALSVPFTFGHTQSIFGRNELYLKHSSIVEELSGIDTIVFDKTGTLTDLNSFDVQFNQLDKTDRLLTEIKSLVRHSFHPLSQAIYQHIDIQNEIEVKDFQEVSGLGISGQIGHRVLKIGSAEFMGISAPKQLDSASEVYVSVDGKSAGFISVRSHYRRNWEELLKSLVKNYEFHLLSGDNEKDKDNIAAITGSSANLHFNQTPKDKMEYINALNNAGRKVLMVGDGLNDAGALKESDVGISVAEDIYQFSPASDAIIKASALPFLLRFLNFSKIAKRVVWLSFVFSFLYNIVGIYYAASGRLSPLIAAILMPLSSVTIVILTTSLTYLFGRRLNFK